jgi:threonine 3-dehydrogenase
MCDVSTCLITGGAGNLACQLSWALADRFERVVLFDVAEAPVGRIAPAATFERGDLLDQARLDELFVRHQPAAVIHLASLLSGSCEQDRVRGWRVNMDGTFLLLETALRRGAPAVLFASSVAAFGGKLPDVLMDDTPQWPDGLYGVTKMAGERLGVYYHRCHGLDFRCLRLPITVSRYAPAGAASALASHAFIAAARQEPFTFRAWPDTRLGLIYVPDVLRAFADLSAAPASRLTRRVYNIHAMTVTPREIAAAIVRRFPHAELHFEPDPAVATLLASWPGDIDDSAARRDWGWKPEFDLDRTADHFLQEIGHELANA